MTLAQLTHEHNRRNSQNGDDTEEMERVVITCAREQFIIREIYVNFVALNANLQSFLIKNIVTCHIVLVISFDVKLSWCFQMKVKSLAFW